MTTSAKNSPAIGASITVGTGTCGIAAGAQKVVDEFRKQIDQAGLKGVALKETGCLGMCYAEVLVEVKTGAIAYLYANVTPDKVTRIIAEHIKKNEPVQDWVALKDYRKGSEEAFLQKQKRIVLRNCGRINPLSLDDYLARDGYKALRKVLDDFAPDQLIQMVTDSGLRGRGGAGFPTGQKWKFARASKSDEKYVVCNADEGDPGAFMDRSVLEGDPHSVIEGMLMCGYAIGAEHGYVYCRAEYPMAIVNLQNAIKQAQGKGFLGDRILGKDFSFHIKIKEGAGAFVCGEETALLASIEGRRGMPRIRPPYPAVKGLWGKPTNINNVETFANLPWIILNGPEAFAAMGTAKSKGSKVFAIAGKAKRPGLVEVPMGLTINEVVFDVCGGILGDKKFKGVQMGGPSGGCIPASLGNTQIDYEQITQTGAIMGSGGLIVMDETTCMVEMARFFLEFTQNESCGKCTSCRLGTLRMLEILQRIVDGKGEEKDLATLLDLGIQIKDSSLCGLGQSAPNPVLTTIKYFRDEYEAHIREKKCPAHSCQALVIYEIDPKRCTGCTLCARDCPTKAIAGERRAAHTIDQKTCVKCGKCFAVCNFDAVYKK